jgi:death-on-curing protein
VINYLTVEQVPFLYARLIEETGGRHDVRELGLLELAMARPQATFESDDLYADLFDKAAALMESIVNNHPFADGNKRTGIAATALFLRVNGWRLSTTNSQLETFTSHVATSKLTFADIVAWFRVHSISDDV